MDYDKTLDALSCWAAGDENVRALVLTGSAAAGQAHPLSDRDLEIHVTDPAPLLESDAWWEGLGEVLVVERLANSSGHPTRLIYFVGGKLDFTVIQTPAGTALSYERPFVFLLDKDALEARATSARAPAPTPRAAEFAEAMNWGYAAALMAAKAIVRDEFWMAKLRDNDLKRQLLRVIEWDHHSRHGADFDTRYLGTRMTEWMDADVRAALAECWGRLDAADAGRALEASIRLFAEVSTRLAERLSLEAFPHAALDAELRRVLDRGGARN